MFVHCIRRVIAALALLLSISSASARPVSNAFTFQGVLKQGSSAINGMVDVQFNAFAAPAGGSPINSAPVVQTVTAIDGLITTEVDFGAIPQVFAGSERWLEIAVRSPSGSGSYTTLSPRQRVAATPYALFAQNAAISGPQANAVSFNNAANTYTGNGSGLTNLNASNISSGTMSLTTADNLQIIQATNSSSSLGSKTISARSTATTGETYTVYAVNSSPEGRGVYGEANAGTGSNNYGGYFKSNGTSGRGVFGSANASTGTNYGGYFYSNGDDGCGVYGEANSPTGLTSGGRFQNSGVSGAGVRGFALALSGLTYGGYFSSESNNGRGVYGSCPSPTGATYGGYFRSDSTSGRGVYGVATAGSGTTYGGYFQNDSTSGRGVYGKATAGTGATYGGYFDNDSTNGRGVYGEASSPTGFTYGGRFQSNSVDGLGVYGLAPATTGENYGVYGVSNSTSGTGVYGTANAATGSTNGVFGRSTSTTGRAVLGASVAGTGICYGVFGQSQSTSGRGVIGVSLATSGSTYGVIGQVDAGSTGFGVQSTGDFAATGTKAFRIDHPDDPANKYLMHYAAESPEVINFYRGTITLNGAGEAVVELPHYFAKINKLPSYQLTAVGSAMPNLHVAEKISESSLSTGAAAEPDDVAPLCWFRIAGGAPGGEVSWRVEAVRNDKWVRRRPVPVEVEKQGEERGTYQHPELYGQPRELGMNYNASRDERLRPDLAAEPTHSSSSPNRP